MLRGMVLRDRLRRYGMSACIRVGRGAARPVTPARERVSLATGLYFMSPYLGTLPSFLWVPPQ